MPKKRLSYKEVFMFLLLFIVCTFLSFSIGKGSSFSVAFYISVMFLGFNPLVASFAYLSGYLLSLNLKIIYSALVAIVFLLPYFTHLKKKNKKAGAELILFSLLSNLGFLLFMTEKELVFRLVECAISVILTFVFISSSRTLFIKKFSFKPENGELFCLLTFIILLEFGVQNSLGANAVKSLNIFLILSLSFIAGGGVSTLTAIVLSIVPSLSVYNLNFVAVYAVLALSSTIFIKNSKILSCFCLLAVDLIFMVFTSVYGTFLYTDLIYDLVPIIIFLFMPTSVFSSIKEQINAYKIKCLPRYAVNRTRAVISNRLYGVSQIFSEITKSFENLKDGAENDQDLTFKMVEEVISKVCQNCPSFSRCRQRNLPSKDELFKIISVGIAKNRISLIDLTKKFTDDCGFVNGIIFEINELIGKYRKKAKENQDVLSGKELIQMQSSGVAGILKGMAFDYSKTLSFVDKREKLIANALIKKGISIIEIMMINKEEDYEINLLINNKHLDNADFLKCINEITNRQNSIVFKSAISLNTSAVTIKPSPLTDAVFGLSIRTKQDSTNSGDTHSLTKIDEGKFLIALGDGMGSGVQAEKTSSTAISLIESFYKAGLDSNLILNMVNKVISLNSDDNFSTMDIMTVDLFEKKVDFIKIGTPSSYILTDETIKIVEGSSLPLGILDELSPTGCSFSLQDGSTIILMTDGVSDTFGSSTDLIDFLKTLDNKNPQFISDSILNYALNKNGGVAKDDMTVLAVRIFDKAS